MRWVQRPLLQICWKSAVLTSSSFLPLAQSTVTLLTPPSCSAVDHLPRLLLMHLRPWEAVESFLLGNDFNLLDVLDAVAACIGLMDVDFPFFFVADHLPWLLRPVRLMKWQLQRYWNHSRISLSSLGSSTPTVAAWCPLLLLLSLSRIICPALVGSVGGIASNLRCRRLLHPGLPISPNQALLYCLADHSIAVRLLRVSRVRLGEVGCRQMNGHRWS